MKFYIPTYDRTWKVQEIDTEKVIAGIKQYRVLPHNAGYNINIEYCGIVYNGDNCFKTEEDAWKWIHKEYVPKESRVEVL